MGWALVDIASGNALAVALDRSMLQAGDGQRLDEITDDQAIGALSGSTPLLSLFGRREEPTAVIAPRAPRTRSYTTRYPAMLTDADVDALAGISRSIPEKSTVVEIGSRLGGSAKVILENAPAIRRMYCIDSEWVPGSTAGLDDPGVAQIVDRWGARAHGSCIEFARSYLSPHAGVRLLAKRSPYDLTWWSEPVDFVFEDSSHADPQITENIWFWWNHLRAGGVLAGHDYGSDRYPDVKTAVDAFTSFVGVTPVIASNIWWVAKP